MMGEETSRARARGRRARTADGDHGMRRRCPDGGGLAAWPDGCPSHVARARRQRGRPLPPASGLLLGAARARSNQARPPCRRGSCGGRLVWLGARGCRVSGRRMMLSPCDARRRCGGRRIAVQFRASSVYMFLRGTLHCLGCVWRWSISFSGRY
ncbi:hypothetical protein SEVIR_6G215932v4 [Setaria viridis]